MKTLFKLIISSLVCTALLFTTSCNKKAFEFEPRNDVDIEEALNTQKDLESWMNGAYFRAFVSNNLFGANAIFLSELISADNSTGIDFETNPRSYVVWNGTFAQPSEAYSKTLTLTNTFVANLWTDAYRAIYMTNKAIAKLNLATTTATRNRIRGEALFIRAAMYFELIKHYGSTSNPALGVPLITTETPSDAASISSTLRIPRSPIADVYTQIIADLNEAKTLLPTASSGEGRANRFVASAWLARVHLIRGNYALAGAEADNVIVNGGYTLTTNPLTAFTTENNSEAIWALKRNPQNVAGGTSLALYYLPPDLGGRNGDVLMSPAWVASTFPAGDLRVNNLMVSDDIIGLGYNQYSTLKFSPSSPEQDFTLMRLAEMYLIRAECSVRTATSIGGIAPLTDLNTVFQRANPSAPALGTATLANVLLERERELYLEGARLWDLRRNGSVLLQNARLPRFPTAGALATDNLFVFPIPFREINAIGSDVLTQNPGY